MSEIEKLEEKMARGEKLNLRPDEIIKLITLGVEMERRALGDDPMPTPPKVEVIVDGGCDES